MDKKLSSVLEFELIQQTPMIHFQYNEPGACIRGSELKPKLDRYIINSLKIRPSQIGEFHWIMPSENGNINVDEWFIKTDSPEDRALNYKIKIVQSGDSLTESPYSLYYGNMGTDTKKVEMISGNMEVSIICYIEGLRNSIKKLIYDFFAVSNFGRMQNKGFGSYLIKSTDKEKIGSLLRDYYRAEKCYCAKYSKEKYNEFIKNEKEREESKKREGKTVKNKKSEWSFEQYVFEDIKTMYSAMKSGISFPRYERGIIYKYFHKDRIKNEKKVMKDEGVSPNIKKQKTKINNSFINPKDMRYVRSMLGVGDKIEYIKELINDSPVKDKGKIVKETITISNSDIQRMESPIFFKVIKSDETSYTVYIVAKRINEEIFDKTFVFENIDTKKSIELNTPKSFNIDDFMEYYMNEYNKGNRIAKIKEVN